MQRAVLSGIGSDTMTIDGFEVPGMGAEGGEGMNEFTPAQELAHAWESVGMSLDNIAAMHVEMQRRLGLIEEPCDKCCMFQNSWTYCASCGRKF